MLAEDQGIAFSKFVQYVRNIAAAPCNPAGRLLLDKFHTPEVFRPHSKKTNGFKKPNAKESFGGIGTYVRLGAPSRSRLSRATWRNLPPTRSVLGETVAVGGLAALHVGFRGFNVHSRRFWRENMKSIPIIHFLSLQTGFYRTLARHVDCNGHKTIYGISVSEIFRSPRRRRFEKRQHGLVECIN